MENIKKAYFNILYSGMFWEFFPELTGEWDNDKNKWTDIYNKINSKENNEKEKDTMPI